MLSCIVYCFYISVKCVSTIGYTKVPLMYVIPMFRESIRTMSMNQRRLEKILLHNEVQATITEMSVKTLFHCTFLNYVICVRNVSGITSPTSYFIVSKCIIHRRYFSRHSNKATLYILLFVYGENSFEKKF